jgi:exo-beta-1,3-glucanase (GH17 family)
MAICYGPYRDGQSPGGVQPSEAEIREDLQRLASEWRLIRIYGSSTFGEMVCEVIRKNELPLRVMLGAWLESEGDQPSEVPLDQMRAEQNRAEVAAAIRIANAYPDVVLAVTVGSESQVSWSFHPVATTRLIDYVREVRSQTTIPVSVADDFQFWISPGSQAVAAEIDFIVTHIYAMWHAQPLENAIAFTQARMADVRKAHPKHLIVLGEAGWATSKSAEGDQANRLRGKAGVQEQQVFVRQLKDWAVRDAVCVFLFEAFDESWKGGNDPNDAEKHWGVMYADRTPKWPPHAADEGPPGGPSGPAPRR